MLLHWDVVLGYFCSNYTKAKSFGLQVKYWVLACRNGCESPPSLHCQYLGTTLCCGDWNFCFIFRGSEFSTLISCTEVLVVFLSIYENASHYDDSQWLIPLHILSTFLLSIILLFNLFSWRIL